MIDNASGDDAFPLSMSLPVTRGFSMPLLRSIQTDGDGGGWSNGNSKYLVVISYVRASDVNKHGLSKKSTKKKHDAFDEDMIDGKQSKIK